MREYRDCSDRLIIPLSDDPDAFGLFAERLQARCGVPPKLRLDDLEQRYWDFCQGRSKNPQIAG